jgi:hypothetical protein
MEPSTSGQRQARTQRAAPTALSWEGHAPRSQRQPRPEPQPGPVQAAAVAPGPQDMEDFGLPMFTADDLVSTGPTNDLLLSEQDIDDWAQMLGWE